MSKRTVRSRVIFPAACGFVPWFVAWAVYNNTIGLPDVVHGPLAFGAGLVMFWGIFLSGLLVWPLARSRSAVWWEAGLATLVTPFAWATKEVIRLTVSFTVAESLYYYVSPLSLAAYLAAVAAAGLAEVGVRHRRKNRGEAVGPVWTPLVVGLGALFAIAVLFGRTLGEESFYRWLSGFRALFGPGIGV